MALSSRGLGSTLDFGPFCLDFKVCLGFLTALVGTLFPTLQTMYTILITSALDHWIDSHLDMVIHADIGEMQRSYFTNKIDRFYFIFLLKIFVTNLVCSYLCSFLHLNLFAAVSFCQVVALSSSLPMCPHPDTFDSCHYSLHSGLYPCLTSDLGS